MKVILITGGIGSGKSLVSSILEDRGIPVYDCDSRTKALYLVNPGLRSLLCPDIFDRPEALRTLEEALFPILEEDFLHWADKRELVAMESATILDKEYFRDWGDWVLYVDAPVQLRMERALGRGGADAASIRSRMALQRNHRQDPRVTFVLDNDSSRENLERGVDRFLSSIK